jgi:hypothetical protein
VGVFLWYFDKQGCATAGAEQDVQIAPAFDATKKVQ